MQKNQLNIEKEVSWRVARRYQFMFSGRIVYDLTDEDDIVYLTNRADKVIAWVYLIIPKSYA